MFAAERHKKIQQLVMEYQRVDVQKLSELFRVSETTIRKDLEVLERQGIVVRTHGGALLNKQYTEMHIPTPFSPVKYDGAEVDANISKLVSHLISNDAMIFLGNGQMGLFIAASLKEKQRLTVVSANVSAAAILSEVQNFRAIIPEGELRLRDNCYCVSGNKANEFLSNRYYDFAIFIMDAASFEQGFASYDEWTADLYRAVLPNSREKIACLQSANFGRHAYAKIADLSAMTKIVTDQKIPDAYSTHFYQHNIQVFSAFDFKNIGSSASNRDL